MSRCSRSSRSRQNRSHRLGGTPAQAVRPASPRSLEYSESMDPASITRHFWANACYQRLLNHRRLRRDEAERYELRDAARVLLNAEQQLQVARPVQSRLNMPVHNGGSCGDADFVSRADHSAPVWISSGEKA